MGAPKGTVPHNAFKPTDEQRKMVKAMAACGIPQDQMCAVLGKDRPMDHKTLTKHFEVELATGLAEANTRMAQMLYQTGINGNVTAMIFWLKTRARWKETPAAVELTGKDGGPIETDNANTNVDVPLEAYQAALKKALDEYQ